MLCPTRHGHSFIDYRTENQMEKQNRLHDHCLRLRRRNAVPANDLLSRKSPDARLIGQSWLHFNITSNVRRMAWKLRFFRWKTIRQDGLI
jgi:hypothetical protein